MAGTSGAHLPAAQRHRLKHAFSLERRLHVRLFDSCFPLRLIFLIELCHVRGWNRRPKLHQVQAQRTLLLQTAANARNQMQMKRLNIRAGGRRNFAAHTAAE